MLRLVVPLALCACSPAPQPTARPPLAPTAPAKAAAPPCPDEEALAAKIKQLFGGRFVEDATCAVGAFPGAGWAVSARYNTVRGDEIISVYQLGIVDTSNERVLVSAELEIPPGPVPAWHAGFRRLETHDFDGDGVDEVISLYAQDKRGWGTQREVLAVWRVAGDAWARAFRRQVTYDDGASSCASTWKIESHRGKPAIVLSPNTLPAPDSPECIPSAETWSPGPDGTFSKL